MNETLATEEFRRGNGHGPEAKRGILDLSSRQVAAVAFGGIAVVTLVAAIAYMAGRLTEIEGRVAAGTLVTEARAPGEQLIVVDPPAVTTTPAVTAATPAKRAPAAIPPSVAPPASPSNAAATAVLPPADETASQGQLYFQVAAVDKGMADVSADYLVRKGFSARVSPGPAPAIFRVLVGPLVGEAQANELKGSLEALGFRPFLKRM